MARKKLPTIWDLEPHTEAKHRILDNYLKAWFPIMTLNKKKHKTLLYIDGYAGPGIYSKGEDGSPIIVLKLALSHLKTCEQNNWNIPDIKCLFIEKDKERYKVLCEQIEKVEKHPKLHVETIQADFREMEEYILNYLKAHNAPAFVFIDPFGYKLSFKFNTKLMSFQSCEVFINFMSEYIHRFISRKGQENVISELFGAESYNDWSHLKEASQRDLHDYYKQLLKTHVAKYVRPFTMFDDRNKLIYCLFYCTNDRTGLEKMKYSMWKEDTTGSYSFSLGQLNLFNALPDFEKLRNEIIGEFSKKIVTIETIEDFVLCETDFRLPHLRKPILKPMEQNNEIKVLTPRKKKYTYPPGTKIQFLI